MLTDNWNLNLCRFEILNAGVSSETGTEIAVSRGWDHAGAHIGPPIGKERIAAHEHDLLTYAQDRLREINSLRIIGTARNKGPLISFELKGAHAHDVATILDRYGIAVRAGTHCAMPLLKRFGVTSTCRASLALYSGQDDIDALVEGIEKAQKFFA